MKKSKKQNNDFVSRKLPYWSSGESFHWQDYIQWILNIIMIACAIWVCVVFLSRPSVTIEQTPGGQMCVSEYDYRVNNFCLYISTTKDGRPTYIYEFLPEKNNTNGTK